MVNGGLGSNKVCTLINCQAADRQSYCVALNETIFNAWWVARGEMRKLDGLGRLVIGFDVQDGISCESFSLKHCGIEESDLVL